MDRAIDASPRRSHSLPGYVLAPLLLATSLAGILSVTGYVFGNAAAKSASLQDDRQIKFDQKTTDKFLNAFRKAGNSNLDNPAVVEALGAKGGIRFSLTPLPLAGQVPYGEVPVGIGGMMTSVSQMQDALRDNKSNPKDARVYVLTRQGANGGWIGSWNGLQQAQQKFKTEMAAKQQPVSPAPTN